jgi:hypothetical protein
MKCYAQATISFLRLCCTIHELSTSKNREPSSPEQDSVRFQDPRATSTKMCALQPGTNWPTFLKCFTASVITAVKAVSTSETFINFYQTTRRDISENSHLQDIHLNQVQNVCLCAQIGAKLQTDVLSLFLCTHTSVAQQTQRRLYTLFHRTGKEIWEL